MATADDEAGDGVFGERAFAERDAATGTVDGFEILVGDLLHRLKVALRANPEALSEETKAAVKRLGDHLAEYQVALARPLGEQSAKLIERQGARIRALEKTVEQLEEKLEDKAGLVAEAGAELDSAMDALRAAKVTAKAQARREYAEELLAEAGPDEILRQFVLTRADQVTRKKAGQPDLKPSADHELRLSVEELLWAAGHDEGVRKIILDAIEGYRKRQRETRNGGAR